MAPHGHMTEHPWMVYRALVSKGLAQDCYTQINRHSEKILMES